MVGHHAKTSCSSSSRRAVADGGSEPVSPGPGSASLRDASVGGVLVEALAVGRPVVSTDCPSGPREILRGGAFGPLVPVCDDAALAAAIESVLDRPPDRRLLMQRADAFSLAGGVDRYLEVLLG